MSVYQWIKENTNVNWNTQVNLLKPLETKNSGLVRVNALAIYEFVKKANYKKKKKKIIDNIMALKKYFWQ